MLCAANVILHLPPNKSTRVAHNSGLVNGVRGGRVPATIVWLCWGEVAARHGADPRMGLGRHVGRARFGYSHGAQRMSSDGMCARAMPTPGVRLASAGSLPRCMCHAQRLQERLRWGVCAEIESTSLVREGSCKPCIAAMVPILADTEWSRRCRAGGARRSGGRTGSWSSKRWALGRACPLGVMLVCRWCVAREGGGEARCESSPSSGFAGAVVPSSHIRRPTQHIGCHRVPQLGAAIYQRA